MSSSSSIPPTECKCRLPLMMFTAWTRENPARRFGVCRNKYWYDPKLEYKRYRDHLYEMHMLLNPSQREEPEDEVRSREELALLQAEFADMEGQMQQLMEDLKQSQKNAFFWKSTVIVFEVQNAKAIHKDHQHTIHYIPMHHRTPSLSSADRAFFKNLEGLYFNEG
ncbi:hypothetical protein Tco_1503979 [Tanacetum coccineum]